MPIETRRKSLSLPSLGIQLPNAPKPQRLAKNAAAAAAAAASSPPPSHQAPSPPQAPPSKRLKRSHHQQTETPAASPPASTTTASRPPSALAKDSSSRPRSSSSASKNVSFADRPKTRGRSTYDNTPPPSPRPHHNTSTSKLTPEYISDDIVYEVCQQLEKTGNRPHLIRELATVLTSVSPSVSNSANPGALISSRLQSFFKRDTWTTRKPCPINTGKTTVHPRKVYYYLRTMPKQELPPDSSDIFAGLPVADVLRATTTHSVTAHRIITPSISSASVDGDPEAAEERKRAAFSPSPDIDLSAPILNSRFGSADVPAILSAVASDIEEEEDDEEEVEEMDFATSPAPPGSSFSARSSLGRDGSIGSGAAGAGAAGAADMDLSHNHRAVSPPLEHDEREFTQTASSVRLRGMSLDEPRKLTSPSLSTSTPDGEEESTIHPSVEGSDTSAAAGVVGEGIAAEALFGADSRLNIAAAIPALGGASPLLRPTVKEVVVKQEELQDSSAAASLPAAALPVEGVDDSGKGLGVSGAWTSVMSPSSSLSPSSVGYDGFGLGVVDGEEAGWDARRIEDIEVEELDELFLDF